jgi:Pyruvate/2-oxoacid:ferredoxin oxidoreductase delta subunit
MASMNHTDTSMSITPPSRMSGGERLGMTFGGIGVLGLLIAFLGGGLPSWLPMVIALSCIVAAGILLTRQSSNHKLTVLFLFIMGGVSLAMMFLSWTGIFTIGNVAGNSLVMWILFALSFGIGAVGIVVHFYHRFGKGVAGIRNNGLKQGEVTRKQGSIAWILTIVCTGFYVILYWFPDNLRGLVQVTDPLFHAMTGGHSIDSSGHVTNQWFVYGIIYTLLVIAMGIRFIFKYRHSRYQIIRTVSVMTAQLLISFLLPYVLERLNNDQMSGERKVQWDRLSEEYKTTYLDFNSSYWALEDAKKNSNQAAIDSLTPRLASLQAQVERSQQWIHTLKPQWKSHIFTYFWPLSFYGLEPGTIDGNIGATDEHGYILPWSTGLGTFGWVILGVGLFLSFVGVIVLTYFFGKRWYCSFVCGCGGLAETAGDPFRHLSDKSLKAWRVERVLIHSVLALVTVVTVVLLLDWKLHFLAGGLKEGMKSSYGFVIGTVFAGVVGTGFYPLLGSRIWCRFGCPQAAILGLLQKYFSRFRITTNGSQCISCGNCSTYCEMGIDVKSYAQRGENIVRASCVGCGVCSSVCPRGVLTLENGPKNNRTHGGGPISINKGEIRLEA